MCSRSVNARPIENLFLEEPWQNLLIRMREESFKSESKVGKEFLFFSTYIMGGSKLDTWDFVAVAFYFAAVLGAGLYVSNVTLDKCH